MSEYRKSWHVMNHDRFLRDPFLQALPLGALGLLCHLQCLVGAATRGYETGTLYGEDGRIITVGELLSLLSMDNDSCRSEIKQHLDFLIRARQISCSEPLLASNSRLTLRFWKQDQEAQYE